MEIPKDSNFGVLPVPASKEPSSFRALRTVSLQPRLILRVFVVLALHLQPVAGWWGNSGVRVKYASLQPQINGLYYLSSAWCNSYNVYIQDSTPPLYFISLINHYTNGTKQQYWAIGATMCVASNNVTAVTAFNKLDGEQPKPYDLKTPWFELNSTSGAYVKNSYFLVDDVYYMSVGEIIGILLGCFCLGVLLFSMFVCLCSKCDRNKRRRTQPTSRSNPALRHHRRRESSNNRRGDNPPSYEYDSDPIYMTPMEPPAYDNQPPPSYEIVELEKRLEEGDSALPQYNSLHVSVTVDGESQQGGVVRGGTSLQAGVVTNVSTLGEGAALFSPPPQQGAVTIGTISAQGGATINSISTEGRPTLTTHGCAVASTEGGVSVNSTASNSVASNTQASTNTSERNNTERTSDTAGDRHSEQSVNVSAAMQSNPHRGETNEAYEHDTDL